MEKITWDNIGQIEPFLMTRGNILDFTTNPVFLVRRKYLYEIYEDVLFIFRKGSFYHAKYFFLAFPPFAMGDIVTEKLNLLKTLERIPVVMTEYDMVRYNIKKKDFRFTSKSSQYIYDLDNYHDLTGKSWHKWRVASRSLDRDFVAETIHSDDINQDYFFRSSVRQKILPEILELIQNWTEHNKRYPFLDNYIHQFFDVKMKNTVLMFFRRDGRIEYYVITQKIGSTVFILELKSIVRDVSYSMNKAVLLKLVSYWSCNTKTFFNIGRSKNKGMGNYKKALRPNMMRIFKVEKKNG